MQSELSIYDNITMRNIDIPHNELKKLRQNLNWAKSLKNTLVCTDDSAGWLTLTILIITEIYCWKRKGKKRIFGITANQGETSSALGDISFEIYVIHGAYKQEYLAVVGGGRGVGGGGAVEEVPGRGRGARRRGGPEEGGEEAAGRHGREIAGERGPGPDLRDGGWLACWLAGGAQPRPHPHSPAPTSPRPRSRCRRNQRTGVLPGGGEAAAGGWGASA
jgi:hypothetical protein